MCVSAADIHTYKYTYMTLYGGVFLTTIDFSREFRIVQVCVCDNLKLL